jgi:glycosyltransferase involved in cell wall biosynthesis
MEITAVVLTKNEEKNISACLSSLSFCDEIIIVDDFSDDNTVALAEKFDATVFRKKLDDDFSAQRNFGLSKARKDWVFFIDADERVSPELKAEILRLDEEAYHGFFFSRQDVLWGKALKHGETAKVRLLRLARRNAGKWERHVHEEWQIKGKTTLLKNPLMHYPHPTLNEFIDDINRFSTLHAEANDMEKKRSSLGKIILWPIGKFVYNYLILLGLLDGTRGFIVSMLMSLHSFLAWGKLWKISRS